MPSIPPAHKATPPRMATQIRVVPPSMGWKWVGVGALVAIGTTLVVQAQARTKGPTTSRSR